MSSVSVEVLGKRHAVRVSPMAPLTAVIEAALVAGGIAADPAACKLLHGKKQLDASTPLRFANLPTGAKLELITGQERHLGLSQHAPAAPASPQHAASSSTAVLQRQLSGGQTANATDSASEPPPAARAPGTAAPADSQRQQKPQAAQLASEAAAAAAPSTSSGASPDASAGVPAEGSSGALLQQLLGRQTFVFSRAAEEAQAASSGAAGEEPPDSFYDFTADDYARVARGWGANAAGPAGNAPLKTAKIRAAEAAAAAQRCGPVPVRVLFPDGMALQATFAATDAVSVLQALVARAVAPGAANLHLYTAPPKAVLKQPQATLYEAGLAPAAVVYAGCSGDGGPALRHEVLALQGPPPSRERRPEQRSSAAAAAAAAAVPVGAAQLAAGGESAPQAHSASGAKLPKWLKTKK